MACGCHMPSCHMLSMQPCSALQCGHHELFLFPLSGLLGYWNCVWSPPSSAGDAHSWLAVASHSFCPPTFALRCPMFCRYSLKDVFKNANVGMPRASCYLPGMLCLPHWERIMSKSCKNAQHFLRMEKRQQKDLGWSSDFMVKKKNNAVLQFLEA